MVVTESKMYLVETKSKSTTTENVIPSPSCTCGRAMAMTKNRILSRIVGGIETKVRLSHTTQYVMKTFLDVIASLVSSVRSVHNHFSNN